MMLRVYIFPPVEEARNRLGGMKRRGGDTMRWRVIVLAGVMLLAVSSMACAQGEYDGVYGTGAHSFSSQPFEAY
jgi:hypothetical protein